MIFDNLFERKKAPLKHWKKNRWDSGTVGAKINKINDLACPKPFGTLGTRGTVGRLGHLGQLGRNIVRRLIYFGAIFY